MITLTREEAQQVLDIMESTHFAVADNVKHSVVMEHVTVIELLRARLSAPEPEPVAWRFDQAKYRENDLRGRQWAFNVFSQSKPYMDEMVRNVTPLYKDPTPCQTCEALARTVMMDQASHDTRLQRERVKFPTMLRKMWSGSEVQAWLDETVNKENKT